MWSRWLPWRWMVSRLARSRGFIDPISILSRLHQFAQPSEVTEPIELLRAGVLFHARGLINTRAIQHNLDWVWPYWVERQFNPHDESFIPRAFSITHVNLSHRNWTAVGAPGSDWLPIVDPRGLVTPLYDGWSIDAWIILDDGRQVLPSRLGEVEQRFLTADPVSVDTRADEHGATLHTNTSVVVEDGLSVCRIQVSAGADTPGWLAIALRPANPEGVSFIHRVEAEGGRLHVNDAHDVLLDPTPERVCMSDYRRGDVLQMLPGAAPAARVTDDIGMATAAALYRIDPGVRTQATVRVAAPAAEWGEGGDGHTRASQSWSDALAGACRLRVPDPWMQCLFDAAVRNLVLHSPAEVYPGPYTYKRFWFRDAAFILHALLVLGLDERVRRCLDLYPKRQTHAGYFLSQEGEWDSNGAAIWILNEYRKLTGKALSAELVAAAMKGYDWIRRKRVSETVDKPHAGLMPAGFSAEHLGPNDYYYWDDFWSVAGCRAAAEIDAAVNPARHWTQPEETAAALLAAVERSMPANSRPGIPASPYRRMDAGAIGSVCCGYPLQLVEPRDAKLLATVETLLEHCTVRGGFFQDMIHSGINAYLTLHLAQVLLRAGEAERAFQLTKAVAELASPTGQWPEAIHPRTGGGCMGDGQHLWAAAEWVLMMRNMFVREEAHDADPRGVLVIGQGLPAAWLRAGVELSLGPTPTRFGPLTVEVTPHADRIDVRWSGAWRGEPPTVEVRVVGCEAVRVEGDARHEVTLTRCGRGAMEPTH